MSKLDRFMNAFGTGLMVACYVLALVAASVSALTVVGEGGLTDRGLTIAGVGLGATGVWLALGFFVYAEKSRREFEECLEHRLDDMFELLETCERRCGRNLWIRLRARGY